MVRKSRFILFTFIISSSLFLFYGYMCLFLLEYLTSKGNEIRQENIVKIHIHEPCTESNRTQNIDANDLRGFVKLQGPGTNGAGINISAYNLTPNEKRQLEEGDKAHHFNTYASDIISVHRKAGDLRPDECKSLEYRKDLPAASIIIIFRDELLSILLRTIYSILETTPDHMILEVILVDDGSTLDDLFAKLDIHVNSLPKVYIIRLPNPKGLMVARQTGIERSRSDFFVVMDSHMEMSTGWLEPLLQRLIEKPRALICAKIGNIINKDMHVVSLNDRSQFIGFDYKVDQVWYRYDQSYLQDHSNVTEPIESLMVQGMFAAMRKGFFMQLGGFDTGMDIWGSEQVELSVKVWLCGGTIEIIPCSVVAHLFRVTPWNLNGTATAKNKLRVADVWMDEYKDVVFHTQKNIPVNYGNIEERRKLRSNNKCKPYKYFIDKVKEMNKGIYFPLNPKQKGRIRSIFKNRCISAGTKPIMKPVIDDCRGWSNQYFILTEMSDLRPDGMLCTVLDQKSDELVFKTCSEILDINTKLWSYEMYRTLRNRENCLTVEESRDKLSLHPCHAGPTQQWVWEW